MESHHIGKVGLSLLCCVFASACYQASGVDEGDRVGCEGTEEINYRGQPRIAQICDGQLFIEGDIAVSEKDQACAPVNRSVEGVAVIEQPVSIQGNQFRWRRSDETVVIGYDWAGAVTDVDGDGEEDSFTSAQRDLVQDAMDDWENAVPTLSFEEKSSGDRLVFQRANRCASFVGYQGQDQTVWLADGCVTSFSVHHEIGHALGLYHEHTSKSRGDFITINWQNIQGCTATATSPSQCGSSACGTNPSSTCGCTGSACSNWTNFTTDNKRSDLGEYDYGSVMHYPRWAFSKSSGDSITAEDENGDPISIGQRSRLSTGDIQSVWVLYPRERVHSVLFAPTGVQQVCSLSGRNADTALDQEISGDFGSASQSGGRVDTDELDPGDYNVSCSATSAFWSQNYDYPNEATTVDFDSLPSSSLETYGKSSTVRVLNAGPIPVLI